MQRAAHREICGAANALGANVTVARRWWSHATVSVGDCLCISKVVDNNSGHADQHNSWGPLRALRFDAKDHAAVLEKLDNVPLV